MEIVLVKLLKMIVVFVQKVILVTKKTAIKTVMEIVLVMQPLITVKNVQVVIQE